METKEPLQEIKSNKSDISIKQIDSETFEMLTPISKWHKVEQILPPSYRNVYGEISKPIPPNSITYTTDDITYLDYDIIYYNSLGKNWRDQQGNYYNLNKVERWTILPTIPINVIKKKEISENLLKIFNECDIDNNNFSITEKEELIKKIESVLEEIPGF